MILFDDYTADALYAGVLDDPGNDLRRMILADRLEEIGQAERAEFVRLGCEADYAAKTGPVWDRLRQMVGPKTPRTEWFPGGDGLKLGFAGPGTGAGPALLVARGFPAEVRAPLAWLLGGPAVCPVCFRVGAYMYCEACEGTGYTGTGRTAGRLTGLVRTWPITTVVVTDREPYDSRPDLFGGKAVERFHWYDAGWNAPEVGYTHPESDLPAFVFRALTGFSFEDPDAKFYDTSEAALAALSDAILKVAKEDRST